MELGAIPARVDELAVAVAPDDSVPGVAGGQRRARHNELGVLNSLDELTGRVVDDIGFLPVTDIDRIGGGELYRPRLHEFTDWLRAARSAGILRHERSTTR